MYSLVLFLHSWLRWFVLVAGVGALATTAGAHDDARMVKADKWGMAFMMSLDLQMLLGLLLYLGLSPFTTQAFRDFGAAMSNPALRFWAVEHIAIMIAAVACAHVARVLGRKAPTREAKRKKLLLFFGLSLLLIVIGIPWPGMAAGRPLFRFGM
jgi:hypothetical protein